jgi:polar amino acid transport system substrate-binding protein
MPSVVLALVAIGAAAMPGLASAQSTPASDEQQDAPTPVRLAVRELEPFVLVDGDRYSGFSVQLWEEVAERAGFETEYLLVDDVGEQLDAVATGRADAAVGAISITEEREAAWDFSQPIADGGLSVLTTSTDDSGWWSGLRTILGVVAWFVLLLLAVLVIAGHAIWLAERHRNPDIPDDYRHGVPEAMWFAVVSVFTVGYGDHVPRSAVGRLVTVAFVIVGVIAVSQFTASLASRLTAERLTSPVESVDDLGGHPVATVRDTTAAEEMRTRPVDLVEVDDVDAAGRMLLEGEVDAVVYDEPALDWFSRGEGQGRTVLVGGVFDPEYYGVATGEGSALTERIDRALLETREDGTWQQIHDEWFG